jgi:hypothetical protein
MTIDYAALGVGAFLVALIFIWKKLRVLDAQLEQMSAEINQLQIQESRRLLMALNAKPNASGSKVESNNMPVGPNIYVGACGDHEHAPRSLGLDPDTLCATGHERGDLVSLVPLAQIEDFLPVQEDTPARTGDRKWASPGKLDQSE